jgi:PAS domain S-box-containing protein
VSGYNREELAITLFEESGDALFLFDVDTENLLDVNPLAERLTGFPYKELLSMQITYLFRSTVQGGVQRLRNAFRRTGLFHSQEDFLLRQKREGGWVPVNLTVTRLHARPKTLGLITARDITERRTAHERLEKTEAELRRVLNSISDFLWSADVSAGGQIAYRFISPVVTQITGRPPEYYLAGPDRWLNTLHPEDRPRMMEAFEELVGGQVERGEQEYRIIRPDGGVRWVRDRVVVCSGETPSLRRLNGVGSDVTAHKDLEERLRQAEKMEAVGRLAGGVAHDFNNLLTVITGYSDLLLAGLRAKGSARGKAVGADIETGLTDAAQHHLQIIRSTADRAAALTRQLLAFSRKQILTTAVLNLNEVVRGLEDMLRRLIGEDVELTTVLEKDLNHVKVDRGQFEQVILNLVVNARDAMPRGGRIVLKTSNHQLSVEPDLEASPRGSGWGKPAPAAEKTSRQYVMLTVSDTGCGMDEQTQQHLFEPFFTTKEVGKGTGLGLATVYGIINQSGGQIEVESAPGQGAAFRIFLPAVAPPARHGDRAAGEASVRSGRETVLLVEDEEGVRSLARLVLQRNGYTVLEAPTGAEALAVSARHTGPIHLLVTDVVMPGMNGRELADTLMSARPDARILFISGYMEDAIVRNGVQSDSIPFLHKPFTPLALARKVREVLDP